MSTEQDRIRFLVERDGLTSAREWVERTLTIYRDALANRNGFATMPEYRLRFEHAVREFEEWLADTRR